MPLLSFFKKIDWFLTAAVFLLAVFGLAALYSVALGQGGDFLNFQKQLIWLGVGFVLMFFLANFDYHYWLKLSWPAYLLGLAFLLLVLTPLGATIRGSHGWFALGFFSFQPVELMKVFLIIVLADFYSRYGRTIHKFGQLVVIALIVLAPLALILLQPDFGSAMVLFFSWFFSFLIITKNKWHIVAIIVLVSVLFLAGWFLVFKDYQRDRVLTFLNPAAEPEGRGYNVQQSVIAVGGGQLFGRGLGFGSQSQLKFIPESQTDFIFAVIAEELGLVGVVFVLGLFALLFYRLCQIAARAPDDLGLFLALLPAILIFIHVFINIGMSVGLLPVTGISLPFISYGGSFILAVLALIGLALNVHKLGVVARKY